MPSVADDLRRETVEWARRLSPDESVGLALQLGDFDLDLFCSYQGVEREVGFAKLRQSRQVGRRPSGSAGAGP